MGFAQTLLSWRLVHTEDSNSAQEITAPLSSPQNMVCPAIEYVAEFASDSLPRSTANTSEPHLLIPPKSSRNQRNKSARSNRTRKTAQSIKLAALDMQMVRPVDLADDNEKAAKHIAVSEQRKISCLRVIQLHPKEQPARLVISGRMAEVCAALEKLAAHECASNQCL